MLSASILISSNIWNAISKIICYGYGIICKKSTNEEKVVLEYMGAGNLTAITDLHLATGSTRLELTEPFIAYISMCVLKSLSYIHSLHRIHRYALAISIFYLIVEI